MTKGIRFQTKLVLALVAVVAGVTVALVIASEMKIRQTYVRQFSSEFQLLLRGIEQSRQSRTEEFMALSQEMARDPYVVAMLSGEDTSDLAGAFWKQWRPAALLSDSARNAETTGAQSSPERPRVSLDQLHKLGTLAVMTPEGDVTTLQPTFGGTAGQKRRSGKFRASSRSKEEARSILEQFMESGTQQTVFLPVEADQRKPMVQEMLSTPVIDPATGDILGLFLRAAPSETEAERSLERYQEEFDIHDRKETGIYMAGEIYSRTLSDSIAAALSGSIKDFLGNSTEATRPDRFEADLGEESYLVYVDRISRDDALEPAYQIAAFPMSKLRSDLADFRLRGSGIGAVVLLASIGLAFLLAGNLAGPVNELVAGTDAIRAGNLDYRVKVRSSDEIGELAASFNEMAGELKQKALYRELLGKVSDETVAQALVSGSLDLELGGEIKEVSVLFCDIRGFTRQTEEMHPTDVIGMLNEHMTAMTELVRVHGGVVDKFVGDEIMAVFGALKSYGNDAANAAACALEMIERRKQLNDTQSMNVEIGVGVATGEVVAGCMGSVDRLNYTVLGSRVNLAARLCSAAAPMEVVTDDETIRRIHPPPLTKSIPELELKGFSKPVKAFRLRSISTQVAKQQPARRP